MATGWQAREARLLLVAAGPLGMLEFGFGPVVQRIDMLGLALFVCSPGPGAGRRTTSAARRRRRRRPARDRAIWCLRVFAGSR